MRADVPYVPEVVQPVTEGSSVSAAVGGMDLETSCKDLLVGLQHQVVEAAQHSERHHFCRDPDGQVRTVLLAEVHDEVAPGALLVPVVLLEPLAVGGGRLGRRAGIFLPRRAEGPGMPVGKRVDPTEPVADGESEGRLDGAENVAEAHAELMIELVE